MKLYWAPGAIEDLRHPRAYIARENPRSTVEIATNIVEIIAVLHVARRWSET